MPLLLQVTVLYFIVDQASSIHYVEIGGVNSVVTARSPNTVPNTPYSVMHTFTGDDFASEDVASLTVHYSTEETFPPQTPVSGDSSHGICFPFNANDTYATSSHSNVVFTTGTSLPSPGVHYVQASMDVEVSEGLSPNDESSSSRRASTEGYVIREQNSDTEGYIVPEQSSANERYMVQEQSSSSDRYYVREERNSQEQNADSTDYIGDGDLVEHQNTDDQGYIVEEPASPNQGYIVDHAENSPPSEYLEESSQAQEYIARGQSSQRGETTEDLTLPTMVVFTSPEDESAPSDVTTDGQATSGNGDSSENNLGALTLRQRSESTSIGQFAPPSIIFQVSK